MVASRLDRLIDIERKSVTLSSSGEPVETWSPIAAKLAASYSSVRGEERATAAQWVAREQVEFWVRSSVVTRSVTPLDRIVYPPRSGESPPEVVPESRIYDIMAVAEVGRNDRIKITAARRSDVS